MPATTVSRQAAIDAVRQFSRFYTRRLNLLNEKLLDSPFTLTEARVVFELSSRDGTTASAIAQALEIDPSFLSRTLTRLEKCGFISRAPSTDDRRELTVTLTPKGRANALASIKQSELQVQRMLGATPPADQRTLILAMRNIERILGQDNRADDGYLIRTHRPGDIGWVIERHASLYALEYDWDHSFEAMVGEIAINFLKHHDPTCERCWIAEVGGTRVGSVFLVRQSAQVAKLRLLIVDPDGRGLGIGRRLVDECILFATSCGYETLTLWTNDILTAARRIYQRAGFKLVDQAPHHSFGKDLVGQNWNLDLT